MGCMKDWANVCFFGGYTTFFPNSTDYDTGSSPRSWAIIPALRHAMAVHPHSTYFFALSPHALIMNPKLSLTSHIMAPKRLEGLMLKDKPVVPPDSVIKTFSHLKGSKVDLVLTQDGEGLCQGSFIIRQGEWAQFFLDSWFDPLYRSYNFQKAEGHALVSQSFCYFATSPKACNLCHACIGTCCPMASYHPHKIGLDTTKDPELVWHRYSESWRQGSNVQRR